ncbi:unnamed protein product [Closterium sp. NIES-54]
MCIDYRARNRVTVKSRYPIPRADELIDQLRTAWVFSKIDLQGGYHQIRVEPSDCAKTAFRTRYKSFEYTVMPFDLTNAPATFQMTMNEAFRPLLDKCVIIYLDDILRPSSSPFAAPILFTAKKDGGFRMCIDYRARNRVTVKSRYPIPRADELIDQLRTAWVFSKIDLQGGYHQIRVEPSDCAKTAFRTRYKSFEYTVMPFDLTNAPATFQMTMNEAFRPLLDKCVIIYPRRKERERGLN